MQTLIFVYGTLKEGFRNFGINDGRRVPGEFETVERYPLYLVGPRRLPWLVAEPGTDHHVVGEIYEVDAEALARLDELEQVGRPGWYSREDLLVRPRGVGDAGDVGDAANVTAQAYFGSRRRFDTDVAHLGPLAEYTLEHPGSSA